ncbi:MAG: sugar phosphate isomerase/epimerase [Victivallales bacterium]|nr:sugar phosphate isomerase/epimerase [Victivallales bacterium]
MEIGLISSLRSTGKTVMESFQRVADFGLQVTQLTCWDMTTLTPQNAEAVREASQKTGVRVCALWAGYSGPRKWNFTEGPVTLGIVPREYRAQRIQDLKNGADFATAIGTSAIVTHAGFLPENITDEEYIPVRDTLADIAGYCKSRNIGFWFETGQETPVVLLRYIEDIGLDNLGINLDPANLLMYGKGNPCDAVEVFGKYVRNLHVKDGVPPTDGLKLGREVKPGLGRVDFPRLFPRLKELGFDGELVIEREIPEGEEQTRDIQATVQNLKVWWGN